MKKLLLLLALLSINAHAVDVRVSGFVHSDFGNGSITISSYPIPTPYNPRYAYAYQRPHHHHYRPPVYVVPAPVYRPQPYPYYSPRTFYEREYVPSYPYR